MGNKLRGYVTGALLCRQPRGCKLRLDLEKK